MAAFFVLEECLDRAADRHPLRLDEIFRRLGCDRAFKGVAVFYRVRGNLGFLPASGLRRFPDLAAGNCDAKPFGAAVAAPVTICFSGSPSYGGSVLSITYKYVVRLGYDVT